MAIDASGALVAPVLLQCGQEGWRRFGDPVGTIRADRTADVAGALAQVEAAAGRGLYAAGFLAYEAASAFDRALVTHPPAAVPLAWFGLYEGYESIELPPRHVVEAPNLNWRPLLDRAGYRTSVERIHERIARGDTYQVNFTWRLETSFESDPWSFFLALANRSRTRYAAFLDTGEDAICSLSPELFFRLEGSKLTCRPMKGTARRGLYRAGDDQRRGDLRASAKDRAENVMIVDMVRNDLGRIARPGTVETTRLFDIETYPTVHQMTSTVTAETDSSLVEIMTALFPCASVTGAPKVETMKIIAGLEDRPRGIYTGAIGYVGPGRRALFNVAIRTVHVNRRAGTAEYGTGGGIVWDSEPEAEYLEGRTKTLVLDAGEPDYSLLETIRWEDGKYHLLRRHLDRLADSADFLGFDFDEAQVRAELAGLSERLAEHAPERRADGSAGPPYRVRMLLARDGAVRLEHREMEERALCWRLALAREPIDPENRFYYHKTTARGAYDCFRREAPEAEDVLLWNPSGELTETTVANIALRLNGLWVTPPVSCGLLAGTQRAEYIARGRLAEKVLRHDDLDRAESLAVINSVRGWMPARLAAADAKAAPR